jgi:outer membrane protein OmpA-like peptidoglycan-associated protein
MKRVLIAGAVCSLLAACQAPLPTLQPTSMRHTVFFDWDRANITPQAAATIRTAADQARSGNAVRLDVVGHTDTSGEPGYNMGLSQRRANAVRDELVRDGISPQAIVVSGRGESQPLITTADGVREPQNRRAEITISP